MKWKTLSSELLFDDLWFRVRKDRCLSPTGKIIDPYYVYEFPDWVTALALTADNKVVMVKQYRHAAGETCLELPGGCIDKSDKDPRQAIERELLEETGYQFSQFDFLGTTSANPSTNNNRMNMFLARGGIKVKEQSLDPNEEIELVICSMEELKEHIREKRIIQSMHITVLWYAFQLLGERV